MTNTWSDDRGELVAKLAITAGHAPPLQALRLARTIRRELAVFEREQIEAALNADASYGQVARCLGVSRQAAHMRYRKLKKSKTL